MKCPKCSRENLRHKAVLALGFLLVTLVVVCGGTPQPTDTPVPVSSSIKADYFIVDDEEVIQDFDRATRLDPQ